MKSYWLTIILLGVFSLGIYSCQDEVEPYSTVPSIEFAGFSKTQVNQGDTFTVKIDFTDGDGDLAYQVFNSDACENCDSDPENPSANSCFSHPTFDLFILDNRSGNCWEPRNIPYSASFEEGNPISGRIKLDVRACCYKGTANECNLVNPNDPPETISFRIVLRDRSVNTATSSIPIRSLSSVIDDILLAKASFWSDSALIPADGTIYNA